MNLYARKPGRPLRDGDSQIHLCAPYARIKSVTQVKDTAGCNTYLHARDVVKCEVAQQSTAKAMRGKDLDPSDLRLWCGSNFEKVCGW